MDAETPSISYLDDAGPEGERGGKGGAGGNGTRYGKVANRIVDVITWVLLAVVLLFWAVLGAIFWIPLIIRALLRFSISLIEVSFEGQKPTAAGRMLRDAINFYRRGFVVAVEVVTREEVEKAPEGPLMENRLLLEVLWAILVWYFILLAFGWIQASPLDLWDWFVSIPWGEYFSDLVRRFRG